MSAKNHEFGKSTPFPHFQSYKTVLDDVTQFSLNSTLKQGSGEPIFMKYPNRFLLKQLYQDCSTFISFTLIEREFGNK